jgi:hypothetical protein
MRFILVLIPVTIIIIYYMYCIAYLTDKGVKKAGNVFGSEDGASLPSFFLFSFILFPFIVMPMIIVKRLFRGSLGKFRVKYLSNTIQWLFNAFIRIFTLSWKATKSFLKNS